MFGFKVLIYYLVILFIVVFLASIYFMKAKQ